MIGTALATAILDDLIGTVVASPAYLALVTVEPLSTDTGSTIVETDYGGYARLPVATGDLVAAVDGVKLNGVDMAFPQALSAGTDPIGWAVLCSAATAGDILLTGALDSPVSVDTGNAPTFAAGALALTLVA